MQHNSKGLYFISIGLADERDMSLKALEMAKMCDILYAEFYTTKLNTTTKKLEELIGKSIKVLSREEVEEKYQEIILDEAKNKKVGFLVGGDCFIATTHNALRIEAIKQGIDIKVIHGSSIISAIGETGLHVQKFGPTVSIPSMEKMKNVLPESVYETIRLNLERGLHTLCLLDVLSEYRLMTASDGLNILMSMEEKFSKKVFSGDKEVVVFSQAGNKNSKIVYGNINNLMEKDFPTPSVLIILGELHFTEKDTLELYTRE